MLINNRETLAGRSLTINIGLISFNLLGLTFLVFGYHPSFEDSAALYKIFGYSIMALSLLGIYFFHGMILFAYIARVLVGGLFIVSGLIKANDPKGFSYKLEEYFEDGALAFRIKGWLHWESFSLEFLIQYALVLSVVILILEIVLGTLILLGIKLRISTWLMLFLMLFFTFLTWHTKECDPNDTFADVDTYALNSTAGQAKIAESQINENVTLLKQTDSKVTIREIKRTQCVEDCGCFGDAMKGSIGRSLTPAESFWKDIILLYLVVIIFISCRKIGLNTMKENKIIVPAGLLFIALFSYIFSWYFPVFFGLISILFALWIKRIGGKLLGNEWGMTLAFTVISSIFTTYVLMYLPLKDYRPYHVGSNLMERMNDGEDGKYENTMIYTNNHTQKDTALTVLDESTKTIWGDTATWTFSRRETKVVKAAKLPSIQQFEPSISIDDMTAVEYNFEPIATILNDNMIRYGTLVERSSGEIESYPLEDFEFILEDLDTSLYEIGDTILALDDYFTEVNLKDYILEQEQIIIVFSRILDQGNFGRIEQLKEIAEFSTAQNIPMIMISTASKAQVEKFREYTGLIIPTLQNDETEIKAITRSNPTLMVLNKGVVMGKYSHRTIPSWKWLSENIIQTK